ncbi:MAG: hypothetical protein JWM80_4760 [Cyanobacteria bacterium RYN_339]|nr:hypothetical protein [Cyanobacteria bacterium RYN_339]
MHSLPIALLATLLLAGCRAQDAAVAAPPPARAIPDLPPRAGAPAAQTRLVTGVVRFQGVPQPNARVFARLVASPGVLGEATTGSDGTFAIGLPAAVKAGAVLEIVSEGHGHRLANLALAPAPAVARRLLDRGPLVLDLAQTLALMVLAPRLVAAFQLGTDAAAQAALASLAIAAEALGSEQAGQLLVPEAFDAAVALVLDTAGSFLSSNQARDAVAASVPPGMVEALAAQGDSLNVVIREAVTQEHLPRPDERLLGPLAIGPDNASVPQVFPDVTAAEPQEPAFIPAAPLNGGASGNGDGFGEGAETGFASYSAGLTAITPVAGHFSVPDGPASGAAR